jgi:hypothetical protein
MTEDRRLAQAGSKLDRRLLLAARNDRPPPGAHDAALAVLGMHEALDTGDEGCAARPAGHANALAGKLGVLKVLMAVLATCGAGAAAWTAGHRATGPDGAASVAPLAAPAAREVRSFESPAAGPSAVASAVAAAPAGAPSPGARPAERARTVRAAPRPSSSDGASDLAVEVAAVQRAAQALSGGDADAALAALDEARTRCKHPVLVQEAGLLRARALAMRGQTSEAAALARRLRDADPHGVLADRLGAIADAGAVP